MRPVAMRKESPSFPLAAARYALITLVALLVVGVYRLAFHVNQTTVALTFLVLVLMVATRWRLSYSLYLSLLCTLLYNFFFLPPIGTLNIADPQNWVTLAAFVCASVLVSHLSNSERRAAAESETRREEVERLFEFSEQLLLREDLRVLARTAPSLIASIFKLSGVALYIREDARAYYSDPQDELLPVANFRKFAEDPDAGVKPPPGVRLLPLAFGMKSSGALAITDGDYAEGMYDAIAGLVALLDSVTHELRTPLTAIRAAATMLISQPTIGESDRREMYAVLDEESARLDRLIGQAVEMAQLDSESLQVRARPQSLREVIDLALDDIRPLLRGRTVEILVPEDQPPVAIDRELVRRVLRQLIENKSSVCKARAWAWQLLKRFCEPTEAASK